VLHEPLGHPGPGRGRAVADRAALGQQQLRGLAVPTLVVIAGRSIIHDPQRAAARADLVPGARVELWPAASHALNGEFPDRVAERVGDLLGSIR
jgi:pimeloyl-ACP methyl ester carboxylesterase